MTEASNQRDTENVAVKVTTYEKDASKDNFSDFLGSETDDFVVLTENDVPGSSLNGKQPHELNVIQLKRWLACHGAPVTGRKPELIERYYISQPYNVTYAQTV